MALIVLIQVLPGGIVGSFKNKFNNKNKKKYVETESNSMNFNDYAVNAEVEDDLLEVKDLTRNFGGLTAVDRLNMVIKKGTIHSLIGPNGAGKTTTVNMITGIDKLSDGEIIFNGENITNIEPYKLPKSGISRTYQHVRLFGSMSVIDNVVISDGLFCSYNIFDSIFQTKKMKKQEEKSYKEAYNLLKLFGLSDCADLPSKSLSSGQQKLLELARSIQMRPVLLVLDEPCAGLNETEVSILSKLIAEMKNVGITVLLIEHHMSMVMEISDYITVINFGKKIAEGKPEEVCKDPIVKKAYLGNEVN